MLSTMDTRASMTDMVSAPPGTYSQVGETDNKKQITKYLQILRQAEMSSGF